MSPGNSLAMDQNISKSFKILLPFLSHQFISCVSVYLTFIWHPLPVPRLVVCSSSPRISHRVPKGSKRQPSDRKHVHSSPGILAGGWFISNASESEIQQMWDHDTSWYIMIIYIMSSYGFGILPWVYPSKNGSADVVSCRAHSLKDCWAIHQLASHWATCTSRERWDYQHVTCGCHQDWSLKAF